MMRWLLILGLAVIASMLVIAGLIFLGHIGGKGGVGWDMYPKIIRSRRAIRRILRDYGYRFPVHSFGATGIDPQNLCICIDVVSDVERHLLRADAVLMDRFRQALLESGYPAASVPWVSFSIESKETVDKKFGGNWYFARK